MVMTRRLSPCGSLRARAADSSVQSFAPDRKVLARRKTLFDSAPVCCKLRFIMTLTAPSRSSTGIRSCAATRERTVCAAPGTLSDAELPTLLRLRFCTMAACDRHTVLPLRFCLGVSLLLGLSAACGGKSSARDGGGSTSTLASGGVLSYGGSSTQGGGGGQAGGTGGAWTTGGAQGGSASGGNVQGGSGGGEGGAKATGGTAASGGSGPGGTKTAPGGRTSGGAGGLAEGGSGGMGGTAGAGGLSMSGGTSGLGGAGGTAGTGGLTAFCNLPPDPGTCSGATLKFAYNPSSRSCSSFSYTGCGGNDNRFDTFEACSAACVGLLACPPTRPLAYSRDGCSGQSGCWYAGDCLVIPFGVGRCRIVDPLCPANNADGGADPSVFRMCSCVSIVWGCGMDLRQCMP